MATNPGLIVERLREMNGFYKESDTSILREAVSLLNNHHSTRPLADCLNKRTEHFVQRGRPYEILDGATCMALATAAAVINIYFCEHDTQAH